MSARKDSFKHRVLIVLTTCILSVTLSSCSSSTDVNSDSMQDRLTEDRKPTEQDLIGIWEQVGYGLLVKIDTDSFEMFEFTRASCLQTQTLNGEVVNGLIGDIVEATTISTDMKTLTSMDPGKLFSETLIKRDAMPEYCVPELIINQSTPTLVFDHLWNSFNDYYAFFNEREVNWDAQGATFRPQVTDDMSDQQLFELLAEMIDPLDDGHVGLTAQIGNLESGFSPAHDVSIFKAELVEPFSKQTEFDNLDDYFIFQLDRARQVSLQSVIDLKQAGPEIEGILPAPIYWGTLNDNIGYINITRMFLFDESFDIAAQGLESYELDKDLIALNLILDEVMGDLQGTQALIIDVRTNSGGDDSVSIEFVNRFATDAVQVISKFARYYNGETTVQHALTTPRANPYTAPVVVLSSQESASAAEIFLMAMNSLSNVTLMGDESQGVLSDVLDKSLPNGWQISLSNEVYSDFQDRRYEVSGVPMDIKIKALSFPDIESGLDSALNRALIHLVP